MLGRIRAHGERRSRTRGTGLLAAGLLVLTSIVGTTVLAVPAGAQADGAGQPADGSTGLDATSLGLEVTAGFEGQALRNSFMPVTVRLEPKQLFAGELEVASSSGAVETRQIEVAGGAAKAFTFVLPSGSVRVRVRPDGSDQAVQVRPDVNGDPGGALVGVGVGESEALTGVPTARIVGTDERVLWVPVDVTLLERSSQVLNSLETLVLSSEDLDMLGEVGLRNLELAVLGGLNLVLSLDVGPTPDQLPWRPATAVAAGVGQAPPTVTPADDSWTVLGEDVRLTAATGQPVAASVPTGHGRVVMTGLAPDAGPGATEHVWATLVAQRDAVGQLDGEFTSQRGWLVSQALSSGGALNLPGLGLLGGFALLYVLAAGPGNALLLRRLGRNELGWVTLPAITAVFLVGAFLTASGTQPKVGLAGSVRTWSDGAGTELALAAIRAPSEGEHTIELPGPDWEVDGTADVNGIQVRVDRATGNVIAAMDLQALQVGTVVGQRPIDDSPPLQVDVAGDGDNVEVTVTNISDRTVTGLEVRAAGKTQKIADLAPGESADAKLDIAKLATLPVWEDPFGEIRGMNGQMETPASFRALLRGTLLASRPGRVVVVGEVKDTISTILADNTPTDGVGELIAVARTIEGDAAITGQVRPGHVDRSLLVGAFQHGWQPSAHAVEGQLTAFLRYRLPARAAGRVASLVPDVERGEGHLEGGMMPEPMPDLPPGPLAEGVCLEVNDFFPDGSASSSQTCGDVAPEMPGCPADATSCEFGPEFWAFEFEDGRRQEGHITFQDQPGVVVEQPFRQGRLADALEVFNHRTGEWSLLNQVTAADGSLSTEHLSPMGEVLLRVSGGLFPFDYSARGMGATLIGGQA